jgi:hypothetical protein
VKPVRGRWIRGRVDRGGEHITLSYDGMMVAVVAPDNDGKTFRVEFVTSGDQVTEAMREAVKRELDFYLVELNEADAWRYAQYHCSTASNLYSNVRWSYYPHGHQAEVT